MRWSPAIPAVSPITDRSSIFLRYLALGLCNFGKGCRPHHAHPKLVKSLAYQSLGIKKEAKCRNLYYFRERGRRVGCYCIFREFVADLGSGKIQNRDVLGDCHAE